MKVHFENFENDGVAAPLYSTAMLKDSGNKHIKMQLRSDPTDPNSQKLDRYFYVFETGTPEQYLLWRAETDELLKALNLTTGPTQFNMVQQVLGGTPKETFKNYFTQGVNVTVDNVRKALQKVASEIFPENAVQKQASYLRYNRKKPNKLTIRRVHQRLLTIIRWMEYFPSDGGTRTEPVLDHHEIRDSLNVILFNLLPNAWKAELGKNPTFDHNQCDGLKVMEWAERIETAEGISVAKKENSNFKGQKNQKGKGKASNGNAKGGAETGVRNDGGNRSISISNSRSCRLHGENCGHSDSNCKVWKDHALKVKAQYMARYKGNNSYKTPPHKKQENYKWKKPTSEKKKTSDEELHALIKANPDKFQKMIDEVNLNEMEADVESMDIDGNNKMKED